ncbi:flagellar protein FliT [Azotosporobacter soli]|uniref:flagellar protein FliT n=1 Tax=Azotosporobacter soli TaxID=3055040 RepID=UPI0031FF4309
MTIAASESEYWQKYLYFTNELKKFLVCEDWETFNSLLEERQKMQSEPAEPLQAELYDEINRLDQELKSLLSQKLYQMKQSQQVSRAYESMGQEDTGLWMDRKR